MPQTIRSHSKGKSSRAPLRSKPKGANSPSAVLGQARVEGTREVEKSSVEAITAITGTSPIKSQTQNFFKALRANMPDNVLDMTTGMQYGEQSKYVVYRVPDEFESIELLQITDVQFGHVECKYKRVIEYRDWVLAKPNRFMLWCGDNVDAHALWSPGVAWDNLYDPQTQVMQFVKVWGPARHRILGYVGGNHERRAIPGFGDLGVLIASMLEIPYSDGRQLIDIYFGEHKPFKITLWHGRGNARTKGTVAQILDRFMQHGDSQLYLMGHVHQALVMPTWKEVRTPGSRRIKLMKSMGAVGTSFLETWGTYGEVAGFSSSDVMMARSIIERNGKWGLSLK